ncbi:MAG: SURF1 family protein [Saccharothrix sp.]|nr:SURF1 family protein [Saccharothrix sp.]
MHGQRPGAGHRHTPGPGRLRRHRVRRRGDPQHLQTRLLRSRPGQRHGRVAARQPADPGVGQGAPAGRPGGAPAGGGRGHRAAHGPPRCDLRVPVRVAADRRHRGQRQLYAGRQPARPAAAGARPRVRARGRRRQARRSAADRGVRRRGLPHRRLPGRGLPEGRVSDRAPDARAAHPRAGRPHRAGYRGGVHRFLLQPRWVAFHVLVLVAVPVCAALGLWQFQRYHEHSKSTDKASEAEVAAAPAVPFAQALDGGWQITPDDRGQQAVVDGRYDPADQLLVPGREVDGRDGTYILTPLRPTGAEDRRLLVVRGWLAGTPAPGAVPAAPGGEVRVTGRLELSETEHGSGIDRRVGLPAGQVSLISTPELVNLLPYQLYDGYLALTAQDPADTSGLTAVPPAKAQKDGGISGRAWQNLGYTAQWFVFAGAAVFLWWRVVRREIEERQEAEEAAVLRELGLEPESRDPSVPA